MLTFVAASVLFLHQPVLREVLHSQAFAQAAAGEYPAAQQGWTLLLWIDPEDDRAWYHRAMAKLMLGNLAGARHDYQAGEQCGSDALALRWMQAVAAGNNQVIVLLSERILQKKTLNLSATLFYAIALHNTGRYRAAGTLFHAVSHTWMNCHRSTGPSTTRRRC